MKSETFQPTPSVTTTCAAGNWRDHSLFLFVSGTVLTQTLSNSLPRPSPDLLDALDALDAIEDQFDGIHGRAALLNPAERPAIAWDEIKDRFPR